MNVKEAFEQYKGCVVRITVELPSGDLSTGTGFHIGKGYLVTARHIIEGNTIHEVMEEDSVESMEVKRVIYHKNPKIDLAVLETDPLLKSWEKMGVIEVGGHLDDWIGDAFVLTKALLMGFPPIPLSKYPVLVAIEAEVNAVIDRYDTLHPYFVLSSIPRGGFSGGPVISEWNFLLGTLVHSLYEGDKSSELGFAAAISVEPLLALIYEAQIDCGENSRFAKELLDHGYLDDYLEPIP